MIRTGLIGSLIGIAIMSTIVVWTVSQLPQTGQIPVHWDASGQADRFADRGEAILLLWLMPIIAAALTALLSIIPIINPRKSNLQKSSKAYLVTWIGTISLLTLVTAGVCYAMLKGSGQADTAHSPALVRVLIAGCSALFVVIGNYLPKTRPNWFLGIRTPWTLSSDFTWEKTHRLGGRLFILAGILGMLGAFIFSGIWLALQLSILVISVALISIVYSYIVWRSAEDRDTGAEYTV